MRTTGSDYSRICTFRLKCPSTLIHTLGARFNQNSYLKQKTTLVQKRSGSKRLKVERYSKGFTLGTILWMCFINKKKRSSIKIMGLCKDLAM